MKQLSTLALVLGLGTAGLQAQQPVPVWMTFSGSNLSTQINLQAGTAPAGDITLAGHSSLGVFTLHYLGANAAAPSGSCGGPNLLNFPNGPGGGVFRFQDGSLLITKLTGGSACLDPATGAVTLTVTDQITGGTGIFKNATGTLKYSIAVRVVVTDAMMAPVFVAVDGEGAGTIVLASTL